MTKLRSLTTDEIWLIPAQEQFEREVALYREEFTHILQDIADLPKPLLLEGAALLPEMVAPLISSPRQAFWLVPSADFQQEHYAKREWIHDVLADCSVPQQGFQNWMARDIQFASYVCEQAQQRDLECLVVDGSLTVDETFQLVEAHFQLHSLNIKKPPPPLSE